MDRRDLRSIGRSAQEELRRRALWLIEHDGMNRGEVARAVGVHRQTVTIWVRRHREAGEDGVLDGRRISPRRCKGLLSDEQCRQVRGWIADRSAEQLELPFALWTARAVLALIEQRFGIRLGLRARPQSGRLSQQRSQAAAPAETAATPEQRARRHRPPGPAPRRAPARTGQELLHAQTRPQYRLICRVHRWNICYGKRAAQI